MEFKRTAGIENYSKNCSNEYETVRENIKYWFQFIYLFPTFFLLCWFLITLRIRYRHYYSRNLFFWVYTADCLASIILILLDLSVTRLFLYFPQHCAYWSTVFIKYRLINHIYFPLYNYVRALRPVTQCAMILSRLACVRDPVAYERRWNRKIRYVLGLIIILPLLVIWNTVISEKEVVFWHGGFFIIYHRKVGWVSLSMHHVVFLILSVIITLITCISIVKRLPIGMENSAYANVIASSVFAAFGFTLQAAFQCYYAFFRCSSWFPSWLVEGQFIIYDVITVGTPLIMLRIASDFRARVFCGPVQSPLEFFEMQAKSEPAKTKKKSLDAVKFNSLDG